MKQTLADGSHILQTTTATVAAIAMVDPSHPEIKHDGSLEIFSSSQGDSQTLTTIFDPVSKEHIDFTSDSKVAHVVTMPSLPPERSSARKVDLGAFSMVYAGSAAGTGQAVTVQAQAIAPQASNGTEPKTQSLGTETMEGVQATERASGKPFPPAPSATTKTW